MKTVKKIVALLLTVMMLVSVLPMAAFAANKLDDEEHSDTSFTKQYTVCTGSKVVKNKINSSDIDLTFDANDDLLYVVEPGVKLRVETGSTTLNDAISLHSGAFYGTGGLGKEFYHGNFIANAGLQGAQEGRDYVLDKSRRGIFNSYKEIRIPNTAQPSVLTLWYRPLLGTDRGMITIVITDTNTVEEYSRVQNLNNRYKVYFAVLTEHGFDGTTSNVDMNELPAEPCRSSLKYINYETHEEKNILGKVTGYNHTLGSDEFAPYGGAKGVNPGNNMGIYTTDPTVPIIKENIGQRADFITSIDGSNTRAVVDYSGKRTKEVTNLVFDYVNDSNVVSSAKGILDKMASTTRTLSSRPKYYAIDGTGLTKSNVANYKLVPYVVKFMTTDAQAGWHIDSAVVPKDWVPLQYDLNLGDGYSIDDVTLPNVRYGNPTWTTTVKTFKIGNSNVAANSIVTVNANKVMSETVDTISYDRTFLGWSTDPHATTAQYLPGSSIAVPKNDTDGDGEGEGVTLYAVWGATIKAESDSGAKVSVENSTKGRTAQKIVPVDVEGTAKVNFHLEDGYAIDKITVDGDPIDGYVVRTDEDGNPVYDGTGDDAKVILDPVYYGEKWQEAVKNGYCEVLRNGNHEVKITTVPAKIDLNFNDDTSYSNTLNTSEDDFTATVDYFFDNAVNNEKLPAGGTWTWTSSNEKVVAVSENNGRQADFTTGKNGTATITATYTYPAGSYTTEATVAVKKMQDNVNVVMDYGLPININLNDYLGYNETVASIDTNGLNVQKVSGDGYVVKYTPAKDSLDKGVVSFTFKNSKGVTGTVKIVPATSVYYEDSFVNFEGNWTPVGSDASAGVTQSVEDDVYGYDPAYGNFTTYSMGSAMKTTVSKDYGNNNNAEGIYPTASFTFKGTGFDVYSYTDNDAGEIKVTYTGRNSGVKKTLLINDYSADEYYQIPTISAKNLTYDTYDVTVQAVYSSLFDKQKDGSYSFWLDAVRIYEPAKGNADAEAQYKLDGEANAKYITLRENLLSSSAASSAITGTTISGEGAIFIDKSGEVESDSDLDHIASDYKNAGPKNEIYLKNGQGIAFTIANYDASKMDDVQIGAKLANGTSGTLNINGKTNVALATATDMYYSIKAEIGEDGNVTLINNSGSTISLTTLKITSSVAAPKLMAAKSTAKFAATAMVQAGTEMKDGVYYVDGKRQNITGGVEVGGYTYYVVNGKAKTGKQGIAAKNANDVLGVGNYYFDEDGRLLTDHFAIIDGLCYVDGKLYGTGAVQDGDDIYYVYSSKVKTGRQGIAAKYANDVLGVGNYYFNEDGKLNKDEILIKNGFCYAKGVQYGTGVVQDGEGIYYICGGKVKTGTIKIAAKDTNNIITAGTYTFGADGKLVD